MVVAAVSAPIAANLDAEKDGCPEAEPSRSIFPLLRLPRELRDQVRGRPPYLTLVSENADCEIDI
jgi:hypothetical protein